MMNILHVSCSPRGGNSESLRLSRQIIEHLLKMHPEAELTDRPLGGEAARLAPLDEPYASSQQSLADVSTQGSAARSDELIRELARADVVVIGTPMHNYGVPAALKLWIDHVVRVRRTFDIGAAGKVGLLPDRPVFIAVSSGGRFSGEGSRQPDFLTPYLKEILGMVGLHDLAFFSVQGVVFGHEALAAARAITREALRQHFASARWTGAGKRAAALSASAAHDN
jgi:FMN-dependent NADH-azoreductase